MIRKLDAYVARSFVRMVAFSVAAFVIVFVSVDALEHMGRWIDRRVELVTFLKYYFYGLPYIVVLVMPVALLLCSLFLVYTLARRNELMAMTCSGVSVPRTYLPLLVVGLIASLVEMALGDFVVPEALYRQSVVRRVEIDGREPTDYSLRTSFSYKTLDGAIMDIGHFDGRRETMNHVSILWLDDLMRVSRRLDADRLAYLNGEWVAFGAQVREMGPSGSVSLTTADSMPLPVLEETPEDFSTRPRAPSEMNFLQLSRYIERVESAGGDTREDTVELWLKFFFPLSNFIMVLVGAPLAARNPRSGKTASIGLAILLAFLFFSLLRFGQTLGHKGTLSPVVAAGLADAVFIAIGAWLMFRPSTS